MAEKDDAGNAITGDAIVVDATNSLVRTDDKLEALLGLDDVVVISTKDSTLVAHRGRAQDAKLHPSLLKVAGRPEWELHREVHRSWGKYDSIDRGVRYQVKQITVMPGAKLSLQKHHHRAEHWVVVAGLARMTNGENTFLLSENESTFIPIGTVHSLENPGSVPLEIIEI